MNPSRWIWSLLLALSFSPLAWSGGSEISLQPTQYSGPRGGNPYFQTYFGARYERELRSNDVASQVILRYESELIGTRHDFTFDLDRAWFRDGHWVWGRAHPWELANFDAADDRWGMLAQFQPINLGIQLSPVLIAPLGVHFVSGEEKGTRFALSFSPIAIPSLGSEVSLNENSVSTNRFGRLPPGSVLVGSTLLPVRYRIDAGDLFTDVLLKPNLSGVLVHPMESGGTLVFGGSLAPDPSATAEVTSNFVRVATDDVAAVALVRPSFPYRGLVFAGHRLELGATGVRLESQVLARTDDQQGVELALRTRGVYVAFAHAFGRSSADYLDHLFRAGATVELVSGLVAEASVKTELNSTQSAWINARLQYLPAPRSEWDFELGADVFSGDTGSYFGEWRTNDRLYGLVRARL